MLLIHLMQFRCDMSAWSRCLGDFAVGKADWSSRVSSHGRKAGLPVSEALPHFFKEIPKKAVGQEVHLCDIRGEYSRGASGSASRLGASMNT